MKRSEPSHKSAIDKYGRNLLEMSSSDEESFRSESIDSDELNEEIDIPEEDDSDESNHEFDMTKQIESIKKKKRRDDANERISRQ